MAHHQQLRPHSATPMARTGPHPTNDPRSAQRAPSGARFRCYAMSASEQLNPGERRTCGRARATAANRSGCARSGRDVSNLQVIRILHTDAVRRSGDGAIVKTCGRAVPRPSGDGCGRADVIWIWPSFRDRHGSCRRVAEGLLIMLM